MSYVLRLSFVYSTAFRQQPINMRPPRMNTAQLGLVRTPFDDPDFLFELKHDGFRALAHIWDGKCELVSRGETLTRASTNFGKISLS
jgi:ATP-dependent DNA ligase